VLRLLTGSTWFSWMTSLVGLTVGHASDGRYSENGLRRYSIYLAMSHGSGARTRLNCGYLSSCGGPRSRRRLRLIVPAGLTAMGISTERQRQPDRSSFVLDRDHLSRTGARRSHAVTPAVALKRNRMTLGGVELGGGCANSSATRKGRPPCVTRGRQVGAPVGRAPARARANSRPCYPSRVGCQPHRRTRQFTPPRAP
jgi:hypothetical protein